MSQESRMGTGPAAARPGRVRRRRGGPSRAVYRWGVVLLMLIASFTFAMIAPAGAWPRVVTALLQGAAVLAALSRAKVNRRLAGLALAAVAVAVVVAAVAALGGRYRAGVADVADATLLVLVPVAVVLEFRRDLTATVQSVMAALCIYVVLGMLFATVASAVSVFSGLPYFVGRASTNSSDYVYFSFITLATVGYGDLVPALRLGRALAVLEGLSGQLYLVTVVALVVSRVGWRGPGASQ
jgi:Ion channel